MVDGGGLENRYGCKPIGGSNPSLSASAASAESVSFLLVGFERAISADRIGRIKDSSNLGSPRLDDISNLAGNAFHCQLNKIFT